jgi:hypothetical protein
MTIGLMNLMLYVINLNTRLNMMMNKIIKPRTVDGVSICMNCIEYEHHMKICKKSFNIWPCSILIGSNRVYQDISLVFDAVILLWIRS